VHGALSKVVIRRVVDRHRNEIRFCYEQALHLHPESAGRVAVKFIVSPTGSVQAAAVESSTLGDAATEQCIVQAVQRWNFPSPQGGGIVIVSYPFVLDTQS
jgi:TonB family protein